ncbi:MAG: hypothetical protein AB7V04_10625 [Desulfomonilaceae bacterium]
MSFALISVGNYGSCQPNPVGGFEVSCSACAPKLALSYEEEAILSRMRALKTEVRPIIERLKSLDSQTFGTGGYSEKILKAERNELIRQVDDLRESWRQWAARLEDANERKWILLGHREAPANFTGSA